MAKKTVSSIYERMERTLFVQADWLADRLADPLISEHNRCAYIKLSCRVHRELRTLGQTWDGKKTIEVPDPPKKPTPVTKGKHSQGLERR